MKENKGFTLVELLVVVAITNILATGILVGLHPNVKFRKQRDTIRKVDLRQIADALEAYYVNNGEYPHPCGRYYTDTAQPCTSANLGGEVANWIPGIVEQSYLKTIPQDPVDTGFYTVWSGNMAYFYVSIDEVAAYGAEAGKYFILGASMEYDIDPLALGGLEETYGTRPLWPDCTNEIGFAYNMYIIRSYHCPGDPPEAQ